MEKIYKKIVSIASMVIVGVLISSCSSEDNAVDNTLGTPKTYSMVINASKSENSKTTRALSLDGNTLNATWATTENIYVTKSGTSFGTLSPQSDGATAVLKGELTGNISVNDELSLTFPRSDIDYDYQDGTLATIASKYDYATATATVTSVNGSSITANDVTFESQQAIVKFVFTNKITGEAIDANYLCFAPLASSTENLNKLDLFIMYPTSSTWSANGGTGIIYTAINSDADLDLNITVQDANFTYYYSKYGVTFERGKYYTVNVKLTPEAESKSISSGNITVPAGKHYRVSGSSSSYTITMEDGAFLTLNANITNSSKSPIYCEGDAYILIEDDQTKTLSATGGNYPGICIGPEGKTLTILGKTGTLNISSIGGAGIGNYGGGSYGNVIINGGIINTSGASNDAYGAGIGCGYGENSPSCGCITINGGTITAVGGRLSAGIGACYGGTCGDIIINGGTVVAKGFSHAAGIGSAFYGTCGNVTIGSDVTSISASTGTTGLSDDAPTTYAVDCDLIGNGYGSKATCGTVTIDGVENATTSSTFSNYNSVVSQTRRANDTWTLTHK